MNLNRISVGRIYRMLLKVGVFVTLFSCGQELRHSYQNDLEILKSRTNIIELTTNNGLSRLVITPDFQGKVITSCNMGLEGNSNGWLNREAFGNQSLTGSEIGGEDRLWIGPLGGQFSFYFQQLEPLAEENWKVPETMNEEPYTVLSAQQHNVHLQKSLKLKNFVGTEFDLEVFRTISIFEKNRIEENLTIDIPEELHYVGYESDHILINKGEVFNLETGLVSIWSAGMFEGTDNSVVIIPLKRKSTKNQIFQYMGTMDSSRFSIHKNVVLFKADGKYRSKIGVPPELAKPIYGCYRPELKTLSIVQYRCVEDSLYSNSHVTVQENPYHGEVIPIYNNGNMDYSPTDVASFFELESTSPLQILNKGEKLNHYHRVYHFTGTNDDLNYISQELLGIEIHQCSLK